jgi:hypothetical protein
MNTERPTITIVTRNGGYQKDRTFQRAMPEWQITRKEPTFDEAQIQKTAPHDESRPVYISEQKARMDAAWVSAMCGAANAVTEGAKKVSKDGGHLYLYTDSIQFIHEPDGTRSHHEKPIGDPVEWAQNSPDALAQSGKTVEIVSSLTAIRCDKNGVSEPATVIVRAQATMRPFGREELVEYAKGSGKNVIPDTAGGISLANGGRQFYDTNKPLTISVQDGLDSKPSELMRFETWGTVPDDVLRPFTCGAFEPAVIRLAQKTQVH